MGFAIAFLVALLPEHTKVRDPFARFQSEGAHLLSGIAECVFALVLFAYGYDSFVDVFGLAAGSIRPGGIGVLGLVLYLTHPIALMSFYLFLEGCVRAFAAAATGRCHGITFLWALQKAVLFVQSRRQEADLRKKLGPDAPDSVRLEQPSGKLVLTSVLDKPWSDRQVVQYGEDLYILSARDFVPQDPYYRYRYTFRRMVPGEIIRGTRVMIST